LLSVIGMARVNNVCCNQFGLNLCSHNCRGFNFVKRENINRLLTKCNNILLQERGFNLLDHFVVSGRLFHAAVELVSVLHDADNISDHEPLCAQNLLKDHLARITIPAEALVCHNPVSEFGAL